MGAEKWRKSKSQPYRHVMKLILWPGLEFTLEGILAKSLRLMYVIPCNYTCRSRLIFNLYFNFAAAAAAKSLQSCPTLCDPIDGSPPGSTVPGILQARTLEWVAMAFSNTWKWKVKVKSLSRADSSRPQGLQPTRPLRPWDFPGKSTGVGCHCLLRPSTLGFLYFKLKNVGHVKFTKENVPFTCMI